MLLDSSIEEKDLAFNGGIQRSSPFGSHDELQRKLQDEGFDASNN